MPRPRASCRAAADPAEVVDVEDTPGSAGSRFDLDGALGRHGLGRMRRRLARRVGGGTVLGIRGLLHRHVEEQPFTR